MYALFWGVQCASQCWRSSSRRNESDRIARTIKSVREWVDEVIVIDSGSTDETVALAKDAGARVIGRAWQGFGRQKRFGELQCRNDWVLNLDADEVVTPALREEIALLFKSGLPKLNAYGMPVPMIYPNCTRPRWLARDHWCVRLYNRRVVRFRDCPLHDSVVTTGHAVGKLNAPLWHYSVRSFPDLVSKLDARTWLAVSERRPKSAAELWLRLVTELPVNFLKYYLGRRHFTGGLTGSVYASVYSWYRYLRVVRMWQAIRSGSETRLSSPGGHAFRL